MSHQLSRVGMRCAVMMTVAALVAGAVWLLVGDTTLALVNRLSDGPGELARLSFDAALTAVCSLALVGCAAWLVVVTSLVAAEALAAAAGQTFAARVSPRLCPAALRRLALAGCGVALATGLAGTPALADPADTADPAAATPPATLVGLAVPDRTVGPGAPLGASGPVVTTVRVSRGDSLWSLAEQALPANADNVEIAAAWRAIHRANPDRIGDDPDLIFPGAALQIPDLDRSYRKESS